MKYRVISFLVLISASGCNGVEHVPPDPATSVADEFYSALGKSDWDRTLSFYAPAFKARVENWPAFLWKLNRQYGPVVQFTLAGSSLAVHQDHPCYLLAFTVSRRLLVSDETLFVCRSTDGTTWSIEGHAFARKDNGKSVTAGIIPHEVSVGF